MQNANLPSTSHPRMAECQLYPSVGQLGVQSPVGLSQKCCRGAGGCSSQGDRKESNGGGELSLGGSRESLRSHKMPKEDGDKQPLTPKRPSICIIHAQLA